MAVKIENENAEVTRGFYLEDHENERDGRGQTLAKSSPFLPGNKTSQNRLNLAPFDPELSMFYLSPTWPAPKGLKNLAAGLNGAKCLGQRHLKRAVP